MEQSIINTISSFFLNEKEGVMEATFMYANRKIWLYVKVGDATFDMSDRADGSALIRMVIPHSWMERLLSGEERMRLYLESVLHHELYHAQDEALTALPEAERAQMRAHTPYFQLPWEVRAYKAKWTYLVERKGVEWTLQIPAMRKIAAELGLREGEGV